MAALPVAEVRVLADAHTIPRTDTPHRVILRGVETVRDAMPMLAVLTNKLLKLKGGVEFGTAADREDGDSGSNDDYSASDDEVGDSASSESDDDNEGGIDNNGGWFFGNMQPLRHTAVLLEELLDDIIPRLERRPGGRDNDKEIRRVGPVVAGQPGELSRTLGNKMKKLASHAFRDKRGDVRTRNNRAHVGCPASRLALGSGTGPIRQLHCDAQLEGSIDEELWVGSREFNLSL